MTHSVNQPYSSAYFVTVFILLLFTDYGTAGDDPRILLFLFVFYVYIRFFFKDADSSSDYTAQHSLHYFDNTK